MKKIVVNVTAQYPVIPSRVWKALTDPEEMRLWYFEMIEDFRPEVGFITEFMVENEGREFPHVWEIMEVVPGLRLGQRWTFRGYEGQTYVLFQLEETRGGTEFSVTCTGLETMPQDVPEFKEESCRRGWEYFLKLRLKEYLST